MEQVDVKVNYNQSEEEMEVRRGPWTVEEDFTLINYIAHHGEGRWNSLARCAGLNRTGKSCRLRWLNYLRPDVRRGNITLEEQLLILELHSRWGNRWSKIAQHLPGRTDNEIKNYWRTRVQKHAKQLKCDVNSKQFKDTMRYLWMPRLVERIQAAAAATGSGGDVTGPTALVVDSSSFTNSTTSTTTYDFNRNHNNIINLDQVLVQHPARPINTGGEIHTYSPENSSAIASSDSFGTPISDLTECYNNYPVNNQGNNNNNQEYYCSLANQQFCSYGDQSLISPTGNYLNQGLNFTEQNSHQWMNGEDISDSWWNVDDMWFSQEQFNSNV